MQRYFVDFISNDYYFEKNDIHHIINVMRCHVGDKIEVLKNDSSIDIVEIVSINPFVVKKDCSINQNNELSGHIRLLYCLPKGDKLDLVIQKSCELGVDELILINSSRTVKKMDKDSFNKKINRFNKIIKEACEQCKRNRLLKIVDIVDFKDLIKFDADVSLIAYEKFNYNNINFYEQVKNIKNKTVNILIGAEGGFSEQEFDFCVNNGYIPISLGKRILRSETSCLYTLSVISFFMENV
ncbi:MAG: RsmE family RNA methyltransferase [Bacillales bacterium]